MGKDRFWEGKDSAHIAVEEQSLLSSVTKRMCAFWANGRGQLGAKQRRSWALHAPVIDFCLPLHGHAGCLHSLGTGMGTGSEGPAPASSANPHPVQYEKAHRMGARGSEADS